MGCDGLTLGSVWGWNGCIYHTSARLLETVRATVLLVTGVACYNAVMRLLARAIHYHRIIIEWLTFK